MSDVSGNTTASSLAITENRATTHRSGGCVGIFFQLFDWNRRFAKKKLFSMKLLPPARSKQTSKKFKGNEKKATSKLHLIADENEGGFPKMRKNAKSGADSEHNSYETRAPSLVARLMGLESMPVAREKPRKGSSSEACDNVGKAVSSVSGSWNTDANIEKGSVKQDSRPQKLQKTGQSESHAVNRINPESGFQIKNVLSRSRKHYHHHNHHPKFISPVKSPRIPSGKNVSRTSRLIDAATRILEPGLQSSSKRNALTYTGSVHYFHPNSEPLTERMMLRSEETPTDSFTAQNSCKDCGNLLNVNCWPNVEQESAVFPYSCSDYPSSCSVERTERTRDWDRPVSPIRREKEETYDVRSNSKPVIERKFMRSEGLAPWPSSNRPRGFQIDGPSSVNFRKRVQTKDQMPVSRDRTPPRNSSRPHNVESRRVQSTGNSVRGNIDFVSLNRNVSAHSRARVPSRVDNSNKYFMEKRAFDGREEIIPQMRSPVRKRTSNFGGQVESKGLVGSTPLTNQSYTRGLVGSKREADKETKSNSNGVKSFTFNSPVRQRPAMELKAVDKEIKMITCREPSSFKGDSIAALLEQKLKELTSQEDDEVVMGRSPKRSTAMILQELISALTAERPDIALASTAETKHERSGGKLKVTDHLSPGSVLEASFSSSSVDESSGHRVYTDSIDYSSDQMHYLGPDSDILDSATSSRKDTTGFERVMILVATVSRVLDAISLAGGRLTEIGLNHAKQVVLNAELLFGNAQLFRLDGLERLFLGPILLELEAIANIAWTNINMLTGSDPAKSGNNQYRGFLFDSLIECLERKYGRHLNSGFGAWKKIPPRMDRETIIEDVENDMKKWTRLVGMATDEIVEWEMSHSLGKWTDFDIEAFEIGAEACEDILDALVEETLIGLWGKRNSD